MLVADLQNLLESLAPAALAQPGDSSGLLVGDEAAPVRQILAALELTEPVLDEAEAEGYDTILTHHPLLFTPVQSLIDSHSQGRMLRRLVGANMTLIACHTNLDAAAGGLAEIAGAALGLQGMVPLQPAGAGWCKLVGFVPADAVDAVAAAVFATGAGTIGDYRECAFALEGTGWFTAGPASSPAIGQVGKPERVREVRWETVVPRALLGEVLRVFVEAHPYEEPAFDIYPVDDVLPRVGLGRVGALAEAMTVGALAARAVETFELTAASWSGDGERPVQRVGVLPGSGRTHIEAAGGRCEALVTGDVSYHDADRAAERGVALIDVPHGEFEWWTFKRWVTGLATEFEDSDVSVSVSRKWRSPWERLTVGGGGCTERNPGAGDSPVPTGRDVAVPKVRVWIDGGSRGNPGPSAIGLVVEDDRGTVLETLGRTIGVTTNNVAEYQALLAGLGVAARLGAREIEVLSDSELLVKQILGEYKVKNAGLKPLHAEAYERIGGFSNFAIRHVEREQNVRADELVNRALDEDKEPGL